MLIPTLINCICASEASDNEVTRCDIIDSTLNEYWLRGSTLDGVMKCKLALLLNKTNEREYSYSCTLQVYFCYYCCDYYYEKKKKEIHYGYCTELLIDYHLMTYQCWCHHYHHTRLSILPRSHIM